MVAAPRTWKELDSKFITQLDFTEVIERVQEDGDIMGGVGRRRTCQSKRDAAKTPEPVPVGRAKPSVGAAERRADRLPREPPCGTDGGSSARVWNVRGRHRQGRIRRRTRRHLDASRYELENWRDGEEVIAVLHGKNHGAHRYAPIHTGGEGKADHNWLIRLTKDQP